MSLLTICQNVASVAGFSVPSTIVGNTDDTAALLLALANRAGKTLSRKPWSELQKDYTFTTVAGNSAYSLPSDYGWFINDTAWDRTNYWAMRGSLSPQDWQVYKSGIVASSGRSRFRVRSGTILIDPVPTSAVSMVIEYVSNKWTTDGLFTYTSYAGDTYNAMFDEYAVELDLTWRFLERKGLAYGEEREEAEREITKMLSHNTPSNAVSMATNRGGDLPNPTSVSITVAGGVSGSSNGVWGSSW